MIQQEGLKIARLLMVLSSVSPLFILWGVRGNEAVPDCIFVSVFALLVFLPYFFLWLRIRQSRRLKEISEIVVGSVEDHKDHLLVYLFAILLPFYSVGLDSVRDLVAAFLAIGFIIFAFWYLNLHYMNLAFAILGYRIYTIQAPKDGNPITGKAPVVLITKRTKLLENEKVFAYRLSNTVLIEVGQ